MGSHHHKKDKGHDKKGKKKQNICFCDKPPYFHDNVGKGKKDSTYAALGFIPTPPFATNETGTPDHPGPFVSQSQKMFFGIQPRRNTPSNSPERAGRVLIDEKHHKKNPYYKPRLKTIHRNFAEDVLEKERHHKH